MVPAVILKQRLGEGQWGKKKEYLQTVGVAAAPESSRVVGRCQTHSRYSGPVTRAGGASSAEGQEQAGR